MKLHDNTIFISGGGSGIGRGLAEAFHKLGNKVIIGGRRHELLEQTIAANTGGMEGIVLDTKDPQSIQAAAEAVTRNHPALNILINNAGVQRMFDFSAETPIDPAAFAEEIDTNINGVLRMTAAFLPHLKKQSAAALVNVSSGLAFVPLARFPVYCATKAFVHSFSMSLRHQLKNTSVSVIELAPPWVSTDLDALHKAPPESTNGGLRPMPLPDFIAAAMQELASDGQELLVAGAKFLHGAGVSEKCASTFAQMNPS